MARRLTTMLAADVVGYSRLMGADETGTLAALKSLRRELVKPKEVQYQGRTVKLMGDGALMEFASVVDAVAFAVEVQAAMAERNAKVPEDRRIVYRIGLNIGDIIVEGDDIYGDGVNVAARLEELCEPGGVCIAQNVFDQVKGKLDLTFEHLGEREVKNIAEPVTVYRVVLDDKAAALVTPVVQMDAKAAKRNRWPAVTGGLVVCLFGIAALVWWQPWVPDVEPASMDQMAFPLPDRPSIAVLPFTSTSGDPEQEYFADGMTDDLITDLSKVSGLFVIARNSSFSYKGKPVEIRRVAEDLGVRYVLEGRVRRAGDDVRVNAQLIDATTGGHIWAERYDGKVSDIFAVQDTFVRNIVGALALNLSVEEQEEIERGQSSNVEAREAFQEGWEHYFRFTPNDNAKAAEHFKTAVKLDPEYGRAYSALGMVYVRGCQWRWHEELGLSTGEANSTAMYYLEQGRKYSSSLTNVAASQIYMYNEKHDKAFDEAARAVALDPNDPEAHVAMALAMITTGRPEAGLEFVRTALRLNPNYPNHFALAHAMAYFSMDDFEQAVVVLNEALERDPGAVELAPFMAAAYANLGRRVDAHGALQKWQPDATEAEVENLGFTYHVPYAWAKDEKAIETRLRDGLIIAGLPLDVTVDSLVKALQQENADLRQRAAITLGRFGPKAVEAVPALIDALSDKDIVVRDKAAEALGKIGPAAQEAIPVLTALEDAPYVGYQAKKALKRITGR